MAKVVAKILVSFNNVFFYAQEHVLIYHPYYKKEGLYPIRRNILCCPAKRIRILFEFDSQGQILKITSTITNLFEFDIQIGDFVVLEYNPYKPEAYYITKKIVI